MAPAGRRLGDLSIARVVEMIMPFDRQAFFPETSPADWAPHESWLKPQAMDPDTGALLFPIQSYVVRSAHHTILIDTCVGNHKERANRPLWHHKTDDTYRRGLGALGLAPEAIDFVLCTHLHSDHVGWNTRLVDGRWVPTFPKARYVFSRKELEAWERGHPKFTRHPLEDSVLPVIAAGQAELVSNDYAIDDQAWAHAGPPGGLSGFATRARRDVGRPDALAGAVPARRVDGVARLGTGPSQAHPARVHGALRRHRYPDLHRPLPAAVGRPHRRARRRLPLRG